MGTTLALLGLVLAAMMAGVPLAEAAMEGYLRTGEPGSPRLRS